MSVEILENEHQDFHDRRRFYVEIDKKPWRGDQFGRKGGGLIRRFLTAENAHRAYLKFCKQRLLGQK